MKDFLDKHPKLKNPYFWLSIVGLLFASAGIDATTLTSWNLLLTALLSIVENPFTLICVIIAVVGVFNDNSTSGIDGLEKFKINKK